MTTTKTGQKKPDERMAFAAWLALPLSERRPITQREWAAEHNVDQGTLSGWKRTPEVMQVLEQWRESFKPEIGEVVAKMLDAARRGDVPAARLVGDWFGLEAPKKLEHSGKVGLLEWLGSNAE